MKNPLNNNSKSTVLSRRLFLKASTYSGSGLLLSSNAGVIEAPQGSSSQKTTTSLPIPVMPPVKTPDLTGARWIWYPSGRCLQNTFVLFRREINLPAQFRRATGWIAADSRYLLLINGKRIQWGPAPCDPRWMEADPLDLTAVLNPGRNIVGAQVLFYGQGDGTWPMGKPGFLFCLEIEGADGVTQKIVSDQNWLAHLARAWRPGQYKRWYLRALQEEFDARHYPYGWDRVEYVPDHDWLQSMELECAPDKPPTCSDYPDYLLDTRADPAVSQMRPRSIPLLREQPELVKSLVESCWIYWKRSPHEYFDTLTPDAFEVDRTSVAYQTAANTWRVVLDGKRAAALTFDFQQQMVGWPYFTIEAPGGTTVELMVQESHEIGGPPLLNSHFNSWTRFICREGVNHFQTFDFECCRWIQLHLYNTEGAVTIREVGLLQRSYPWGSSPDARIAEPAMDRLIRASVNTLVNSAQETIVDGMGRERQQYSGDCGHQLHAIYLAFGEARLPARYLATYSQGLTLDGYFLDCWPAYDRLARIMERQLQLTKWGPILDHGVGFVFDCYHHYLYTGDLKALEEPFPRLLRFVRYLDSIRGQDGLLPVENIGVPSVWIDHNAYKLQRHKQCAFNLYAAAMLENPLAFLCRTFGESQWEAKIRAIGQEIHEATIRKFWSPENQLYIVNLPWLKEEKERRLCDRSLATAILFDQCPQGETSEALQMLVECPPEMGFSYPANAGWRLWALSKMGRTDIVLKDLRQRWATMDSVAKNNTLQEDWKALPDSSSEWSHCPVVPLYVLYMDIAGIRPLEPGFAHYEIRPQLADLESLHLTARTPHGGIEFTATGHLGKRKVRLQLPSGCRGELVVRKEETLNLPSLPDEVPPGSRRYTLPVNGEVTIELQHT